MKVKLWNKFSAIKTKNEITLRISGHDPHFQMPSISTVTLKLNFPPRSPNIVISPLIGIALKTEFTISVEDIADEDVPLIYRFALYQSPEHQMSDILNATEM